MMRNTCCPFVRQVKVATKPSTAGHSSGVFQEQFEDQSDSANSARDRLKKGRAQVDNQPPLCALASIVSVPPPEIAQEGRAAVVNIQPQRDNHGPDNEGANLETAGLTSSAHAGFAGLAGFALRMYKGRGGFHFENAIDPQFSRTQGIDLQPCVCETALSHTVCLCPHPRSSGHNL